MTVRSRFAPSPTGFLHIGGARTALYAWAFARRHGGTFILRIEDTDLERSTPEAVKAILDGMHWLGLDYDEGPFYQMQRMPRYREVVAQMLADGTAYHCYMTPAELDQLRDAQRARGEKPRYDGTWRPAPGKTLPQKPEGVQPVVRFRNPPDGKVTWDDAVKGPIEIANAELDDLIIARPDGTPTYNFCVCVDDWDMKITHVIRGDDHVNNTPRQINILRALGAQVPVYAHLSMILGDDGQKLSKRHGAVSVMEYPAKGYLRDAVINYLARLGWSHGDAEVFSAEQFCEWFDLEHIVPSAAQFNTEKLNWLNHEYIKKTDPAELARLLTPMLVKEGIKPNHCPSLAQVAELLKNRAPTLVDMAKAAHYFFVAPELSRELLEAQIPAAAEPALEELPDALGLITEWNKAAIHAVLTQVAAKQGLKAGQVMMPVRVLVTGQTQTPAIDAVMELLGQDETIRRLEAGLQSLENRPGIAK